MNLTKRETDVVRLITRGMTSRTIGTILHISEDTVREHVKHACERNHVHSRLRLAMIFNNGEATELLKEIHAKLITDNLYLQCGITEEWMSRCGAVIDLPQEIGD